MYGVCESQRRPLGPLELACNGYKPPYQCWELNLGLLEEKKKMILTTEGSIQLQKIDLSFSFFLCFPFCYFSETRSHCVALLMC